VLYGDPEDDQSGANGIARQLPATRVDPMPAAQLGSDRRSCCLDCDPVCGGQWVQDDRVRAASAANCVLKAQGPAPPLCREAV
jgi:hypothetical protein